MYDHLRQVRTKGNDGVNSIFLSSSMDYFGPQRCLYFKEPSVLKLKPKSVTPKNAALGRNVSCAQQG